MLKCSIGNACKTMEVANQQIQRGIFRSHAQPLNERTLKCLGRDMVLETHIQQLGMPVVQREGAARVVRLMGFL